VEAVRFTLVSGDKFVKTLDLEDAETDDVLGTLKEFKGRAADWIKVDDGAWVRLTAVIAMEPVAKGDV
jgi:hypothetical protein